MFELSDTYGLLHCLTLYVILIYLINIIVVNERVGGIELNYHSTIHINTIRRQLYDNLFHVRQALLVSPSTMTS